jgi:hypothetical protein
MAKRTQRNEDLEELLEESEETLADQATQLLAARSWIGKLIKDIYPDDPHDPKRRFGQVIDANVVDGIVRLQARFAGETEPRLVALEPHDDGHYLYPKDVKARYRRLSELDIKEIKALASSRRAA